MSSTEQSQAQPVVIGYDGSEFSKDAIREAGRLFPGRRALVANVYPSAAATASAAAIGAPVGMLAEAIDRLDEAAREAAQTRANEGAALAREAGLAAEGRAEVTDSSNWSALIRAAEVDDALAVVVGSRGRSGLKQVLLGSTSAALAHYSTCPVVVVPDRRRHSG